MKLPCRAQGRPKPRIIWDRIGNSAVSQLQHHQMGSKITQYLEKETQEDLMAKAKIMSFRSKRSVRRESEHHPSIGTGDNTILANQNARHTFDEIMRDENQSETHKLQRKRRQVSSNEDERDETDENDESRAPDAIPILVFSTQAPQEVSRLQVTDNGELILLDVSERDQVRMKAIINDFFVIESLMPNEFYGFINFSPFQSSKGMVWMCSAE